MFCHHSHRRTQNPAYISAIPLLERGSPFEFPPTYESTRLSGIPCCGRKVHEHSLQDHPIGLLFDATRAEPGHLPFWSVSLSAGPLFRVFHRCQVSLYRNRVTDIYSEPNQGYLCRAVERYSLRNVNVICYFEGSSRPLNTTEISQQRLITRLQTTLKL